MLALFQNEIGYSLGQIATSLVPSPFSNVSQTTLQHCLRHEHYSITLNIGGGRYLRLGDTDDGACVSTHERGGSGGMLPRKIFKIRCSEIASEAIFVLKFIFGLDAARIPARPECFWSAARHVQGSLSHHCTCSSDGVWP